MSQWRPLGEAGRFADWVLALRGESGVYAIRSARTHEVVYVGESHSGRLYETMTRHFQSSSRYYKGPTYERSGYEVKIELCARGEVEDLQYLWLLRLQPTDNILVPDPADDEEIPF